jgi:hypothetical protein
MSFQPVVPLTGYVGWTFLQRTQEAQQDAFNQSQPIKRATDYFQKNIANVRTAADLVSDRQLLSVALGAFGLDEDINNEFFIQKVLDDGTVDNDALANRLSDSRYAELSRAFGFGDLPVPKTSIPSFAADFVRRYEDQQCARAVGSQNNDLRLALNVEDGIKDILSENETEAGQWFSIMGSPPLRAVFQTALGLPDSIANVDVDQQRSIFQDAAQRIFGSDQLSDIGTADAQEKLIRLFLARSEAAEFSAPSSGSTALALLQAFRLGLR